MIAYTQSAQAILRAKIQRLEQLLEEIDRHANQMQALMRLADQIPRRPDRIRE
jgi:uncharacterized protein YukE